MMKLLKELPAIFGLPITRKVQILGREYAISGTGNYLKLFAEGPFHDQLYDVFLRAVKPDDICLDIGANLGLMTLALASIATRGRVIAIEPDRTTADFLRRTVLQAELSNVSVEQSLVGKEGSKKICSPTMGRRGRLLSILISLVFLRPCVRSGPRWSPFRSTALCLGSNSRE